MTIAAGFSWAHFVEPAKYFTSPAIAEASQIRGGDRKSDNIHAMREDCRATQANYYYFVIIIY